MAIQRKLKPYGIRSVQQMLARCRPGQPRDELWRIRLTFPEKHPS